MQASSGPRFLNDFFGLFRNLWKIRNLRAQRSFGKSVTCDNVTSNSAGLLKWKLIVSEGVLVPNHKVSTEPDHNEFHHKRWLSWLTLRALASQVNLVLCSMIREIIMRSLRIHVVTNRFFWRRRGRKIPTTKMMIHQNDARGKFFKLSRHYDWSF